VTVARAAIAWLLALGVTAPASAADQPATRHLRGSEALARAYDRILDARFDEVEILLKEACPPAPAEACQILRVTGLWWRLQLDPNNRSLDASFTSAVESAIAASEAWTTRAPQQAEAWFYLGAAYGLRVQFRVLRGEKLAAARDGKRIKQALERAVELDPALEDAYFGIGLYRYYADVAPAAARLLRWLLLLPGGDKREGLQQMLRAQRSGEVLQDEADYQLHLIYLWYERRPERAVELLAGLRDRHPTNPLFPLLLGDIQDVYFHDPTAALETYRSVWTAARLGRVEEAVLAATQARLGMARQLDLLVETDRAIDHLKDVLEARPAAPYSARALAALRLGLAYDRMGRHDLGSAAYRSALASAPPDDPLGIIPQAKQALRRRPDPAVGEAYRLSLEGWRALEHKDLKQADALLTRSLQLRGNDPVTHFRVGRLAQAHGRQLEALSAFQRAIALGDSCPPTVLAQALLEAGRLHERAGRRDQAASLYQRASVLFGAAAETRRGARRALARVSSAS
jgi:tetratricopeptide (TPR) repeat protein